MNPSMETSSLLHAIKSDGEPFPTTIAAHDIVAVVDDDPAVREALCLMLGSLSIAVQSYANAQEFLDDPDSRECACLVLDVRMPGISGIDLHRRLIETGWHIPVIFITGHGEVPMAVEAMRQGAVDFLQKPVKEQQLLDTVQRTLESSKEGRQLRRAMDVVTARLACLTPREREVLELLVKGQRSKDIAVALGVSLKTIEEYRGNILRKMHVASTAELLGELSRSLPYLAYGKPAGSLSPQRPARLNSTPRSVEQRSYF